MTEQQEQQQNWRGYPAAFTYVFRLILLLLLFLLLRWHYRRLVSVRSLSPSFSRSALCFSLSFEWRYTFFRYQIIFFLCVCYSSPCWSELSFGMFCGKHHAVVFTFWILNIGWRHNCHIDALGLTMMSPNSEIQIVTLTQTHKLCDIYTALLNRFAMAHDCMHLDLCIICSFI